MKCEQMELAVQGQRTGPAGLRLYLLDALSVAPGRLRPMVVVVPGGGYARRSDREAEPVALRFLAMGCHACILDYSVAPNRFPVSLRELLLAVARIRDHAAEWHVDPRAVLVCGFSAGGHLACSAGVFWNHLEVCGGIGRRPEEVRPDGLILCYPVVTAGEFCHAGSMEALLGSEVWASGDGRSKMLEQVSLERHVTGAMPPVFLWHTVADETVPVENSLLLAAALQKNHICYEMHLYPRGRHGLSLATQETAGTREGSVEPCCQSWISLVQSWVENNYMEYGGKTLVK